VYGIHIWFGSRRVLSLSPFAQQRRRQLHGRAASARHTVDNRGKKCDKMRHHASVLWIQIDIFLENSDLPTKKPAANILTQSFQKMHFHHLQKSKMSTVRQKKGLTTVKQIFDLL
jgi:hypothetical protein